MEIEWNLLEQKRYINLGQKKNEVSRTKKSYDAGESFACSMIGIPDKYWWTNTDNLPLFIGDEQQQLLETDSI